MALEVAIIVTDVPPLITLAAAQSLDYLLYPQLPVIVPDAVFHEATFAAGKPISRWSPEPTPHQMRDIANVRPYPGSACADSGTMMKMAR